MDAAHLVKLALAASVPLLVLALGLRASFADATTLFRQLLQPPNRLLRALAAMYVVVPVAVVVLALAVDLARPVKIALLALAVAPIPPILPGKQLRLGGDRGDVFGLLVAVSLVAVVLVPLGVDLLGRAFGRATRFPPLDVAVLVGKTILLPLVAGLAVRRFAPAAAAALAPWAGRLGTLLLVAGLLPLLATSGPAIVALVGDGTLAATAAMVAVALAAGHAVGGPDPDGRTTLALASAMRHPGIAAAIAATNIPDEPRVPAAILLYLLVATAGTAIYGAWRRRVVRATP